MRRGVRPLRWISGVVASAFRLLKRRDRGCQDCNRMLRDLEAARRERGELLEDREKWQGVRMGMRGEIGRLQRELAVSRSQRGAA